MTDANDDHGSCAHARHDDPTARVMALPPAAPLPPARPERGRLPTGLVHAVEAACGAVPGVELKGLTPAIMPKVAPAGVARLELKVDGWSPSLHPLRMQWTAGADPLLLAHDSWDGAAFAPAHAITLAALLDDLLDRIRPLLETQERRAREAARIGVPRPSAMADAVDHLTIDRSVAAILLEAMGGSERRLIAHLSGRVERLHEKALDHRGGTSLHDDRSGVVDEIGTQHLIAGVNVPTPDGTTHGVTMSDDLVTLAAILPATTLAALRGRPFRDLARLHPALDDRTIETAEAFGDQLAVHLRADRIRLADLTPPDPADAD